MAIGRYVVCNDVSKTVVGGPYVWDPVAAPGWQPPVAGTLLTVQAAASGGYAYPTAPPDPTEVLRGKAAQALTTNAAFLALSSPTNPQVVAQVQRLTRECNALIRLLLQQLDDTSDT